MALASNEQIVNGYVTNGQGLVMVTGTIVTESGGWPRDVDGRLVVKAQ